MFSSFIYSHVAQKAENILQKAQEYNIKSAVENVKSTLELVGEVIYEEGAQALGSIFEMVEEISIKIGDEMLLPADDDKFFDVTFEKWKGEDRERLQNFINTVKESTSRFKVGIPILLRFKKTRCGQYFAILISEIGFVLQSPVFQQRIPSKSISLNISKFKPFRVRIIMEEHHREYMNNRHESVVFKEFLNYSSAILWATEWQRMLENGEYDKVYEELNKHFNQELSFAKMPKHCLYLYDQYFIPGEILSVGSREGVYIGDGYVIYVSNGEDIHQRKVKERKLEDFVGNEADAIYVKVFRIQKCSQYEIILAAKHYAEYNMCGALESLCALGYENLDNSVIPRNKLNKSTLTQLYRACHAQTMTLLGYKSHKHHLNYLMQTMKEKLCFAAAFMGFFAGIMFGGVFGILVIFQAAFGISFTFPRIFYALYITCMATSGGYCAFRRTQKFFQISLEQRKSGTIRNLVLFVTHQIYSRCKISAVNIEDQKYIEFPMFCNISEIPPSFKEKIKAIVYIFDDFKYLSLLETEKKMLEKNFMNNGIFCSMISTDFIIINELSSKLKLLQNEIAIVVFVDKIKLKIIEVFRDGNNMLRESNVREENVTELDYNSMDSIILGYIANPKYIIAIKPEYYDGSRALWKIVKRKMKDIRGFEVYKRDWSTNISTVSTLQEISGQFENISEEYLAKKEIATFLV